MSAKLKKFLPLIAPAIIFAALLIAQMSMHGTTTSASRINLENEKAQAYEAKFSNLTLKSTKGTVYNLLKQKQPIIILNFWASWCRPCLSEFAALKKLVDRMGSDKLLVVGINNDTENPKKAVKKIEEDLSLNFESVIDKDSEIADEFFVNEIPTSIVFFKGKVIHFEKKEFDFMSKDFISLLEKKLSLLQ